MRKTGARHNTDRLDESGLSDPERAAPVCVALSYKGLFAPVGVSAARELLRVEGVPLGRIEKGG